MSYLDLFFQRAVQVLVGGTAVTPTRTKNNYSSAFTATDNPATSATDIDLSGARATAATQTRILNWTWQVAADAGDWFAFIHTIQNDVLNRAILIFPDPADWPHGATITALSLGIIGGGGHVSLPSAGNKLAVNVYRSSGGGAAESILTGGTAVEDPSASVVAFEAYHAVSITSALDAAKTTIDRTTYRYWIQVLAEKTDGGVGQVGALVVDGTTTVTRNAGDKIGQD